MKKWKYGLGAAGAAVAVACVLGVSQFIYQHNATGADVRPSATLGPIPCQKAPPNVVTLTPLQRLGKNLLYDCTLSDPEGYACATCHMPQTGFTSALKNGSEINLLAGPMPGVVVGRFGKRRPQSYAYAAFSPEGPFFDDEFAMAFVGGTFWDGRTTDLTAQATEPFLDPNEMANIPTNGIFPPPFGGFSALVAQKAVRKYRQEFKQVFGPNIISRTNRQEQYLLVCAAMAAFEGSPQICQFSSKYDASQFGVPPMDTYTLTASEERGRVLYFGTALCSTCHSSAMFPPVTAMTNGKDTFSMYCFANIGVPKNFGNPFYQETDCTSNPHGCNPLGTNFVDFGLGSNPNPGLDGTKFFNTTPGDLPQFNGLFQAPTVRNVDLRPNPNFVKAYMHNGVFKSLKTVVHFYNKRNIAVNSAGTEVAFDLATGPPTGFTRLFAPPEVLTNVQNSQGALGNIGNLGLTDQEENDLVAFMQILSDGFTTPNPVVGGGATANTKRFTTSKPNPKRVTTSKSKAGSK